MSRPNWAAPKRTDEEKTIIFSYPVNLPTLNLGDFTVQTNNTGALTVQPKDQILTQPAFIAKPVSISSDISGIFLVDSAETGGRIELSDLLNKLIDIPISIGSIEMPIRSLFGQLFAKAALADAAITDLSGVRIPGIVTEQLGNAALDAAREAAQALKDAAQDATSAQAALEAAAATTDIAAVAARVGVLEAAPAFDASAITGRLDAAEAAIGAKADVTYVDGELAGKAAAADLTALDVRVGTAETAVAAAATRLDAVEAAASAAVPQTTYDMYVAANDAAVAAAASAAGAAATAAAAAQTTADAAEVQGYVHKIEVVDNVTAGFSAAYWGETIGAALVADMDLGKLVNYVFDAPATEIVLPAGTPAAGAVRRLRNGNAEGFLPVSLGGVSYEIVAGETAVFQYNGTAWRLL